MMILKREFYVKKDVINTNINRITNQLYKLLPSREEHLDWKKPLETLIVEVYGLASLRNFDSEGECSWFSLLCKMEGLFALTEDKDFQTYRRTIFECLNMLNSLKI